MPQTCGHAWDLLIGGTEPALVGDQRSVCQSLSSVLSILQFSPLFETKMAAAHMTQYPIVHDHPAAAKPWSMEQILAQAICEASHKGWLGPVRDFLLAGGNVDSVVDRHHSTMLMAASGCRQVPSAPIHDPALSCIGPASALCSTHRSEPRKHRHGCFMHASHLNIMH